MERYTYDERNGLWYELQGDYYIPCLTAPETPEIGIWGQRHLRYIREHKRGIYAGLLISGRLNDYLVEVDTNAAQMYDRLVTQMAFEEGITEHLKSKDQMEWVRKMNAVCNVAQEIVNAEVIFI